MTCCTHLRLVDRSETNRLFGLDKQPMKESLAIHIPHNRHPLVSAAYKGTPRIARRKVVDLTFMTPKQGIDMEVRVRHRRGGRIRRFDLP